MGQIPAVELVNHNVDIVEPLHVDYLDVPISDAFDWAHITRDAKRRRQLTSEPWYLVVFRSQLKANADIEALAAHDKHAHDAALESPALIHYFGGTPNEAARSLSFCLWEDAASAKAISGDRRHQAARAMVSAYESYSVEKYDVLHNNGDVQFEARS